MKIYTKITSERASKGQGGNDFIDIEVKGEDGENILELNIKPENDQLIISGYVIHQHPQGKRCEQYLRYKVDKTKGKKQKMDL
ncbi:MAG: hypothetical protein GWP06_12480 [Actinobacteria bacterium]|nr:hypothetical protein [Actinomycetota bacterium]